MASIEERFHAAVNVIKGLPKHGPYQPSTGMMLKFYGYYKQATEGPPGQKRPGFWDVVGKAKWDAWNDNRHLTKQQAMQKYVEDLREIIETMSFTENVQDFVGSIGYLDSINLDELEMVAPGMRELAESHPNSPFNSRTNSPQHGASANNSLDSEEENTTLAMNGHVTQVNGNISGSDVSDSTPENPVITKPTEVVAQTVMLEKPLPPTSTASTYMSSSNGIADQSDDEYGDPVDIHHDLTEAMVHNSELLKQIQATVLRMNADLVTVNQRMHALEKLVHDVRSATSAQNRSNTSPGGRRSAAQHYPKWWPFKDISPAWFVLLVLWPFAVSRITRLLAGGPRRK